MKQIKTILFNIFCFSALLILASCTIGLGDAVDTQAPVVYITSHEDSGYVGQEFLLEGTAADNEKVTLITVDLNDSDIDLHYQIVPGNQWEKRNSTSGDWITVTDSSLGACTLENGIWKWKINIDTAERLSANKITSLNIEVNIKDKAGNTGKNSKTECTLTLDESYPKVSIYKPELLTGEYSEIKTKTASYGPQDGNVLSRLLNGEIEIKGRQSDAVAFKAFAVYFDCGQLSSTDVKYGTLDTVVDGLDSAVTGEEKAKAYIDGILAQSDVKFADEGSYLYEYYTNEENLREWSINVKSDDWVEKLNEWKVSQGKTSKTDIIRIITTSLSSSDKWEHRIIGYFVWCPEADIPWITVAAGSDDDGAGTPELYPGSNYSGQAQDDDGIKVLKSSLYKKNESSAEYEVFTDPVTHELPFENAKYAAWAVKVPSESGLYKIVIEVEDINGTKGQAVTKYFKTSDVSAPKIEISSPLDNTTAIVNAAGDITFKGTASDNSKLKNFEMVWLNPAKRSSPDNKIKYLTGEHSDWDSAAVDGFEDNAGNKIYKFVTNNQSSYSLNKTFNLYSDFGITGKDGKELSSQEFIFRAVDDSGSKTVKTITLTGDSITPEVVFKNIKIGESTQSFENGNIPSFKKIANGTTATVTGTWSDKFTASIKNTSKVNKLKLTWGDYSTEVDVNADGTWTADITAPASGGTITASLKDFGGNTKTVQAAASIETSSLGISRIDCQEDDGSYKVGQVLHITLEFTKNTDVTGTPTLTLNNGGTATFVSDSGTGTGSGTATHVFAYTVGTTDKDTDKTTEGKLSVVGINANGAVWNDSAVKTETISIATKDIPNGSNLHNARTVIIDKTVPVVSGVTCLTTAASYKEGSSILLMLEFSEDVNIQNPGNLAVKFKHTNSGNAVKAVSPTVTGSKYVLFTYSVQDGDNAAPLEFDSIISTSVTVTDNAGNALTSWTPITTPAFTDVIIDTTVPEAPSFGSWNPKRIIFSESGTSFTLTKNGETDIDSIEYSLDNGQNWTPYTETVTLANNGNYTVFARQTDIAGNVSPSASPVIADNNSASNKTITIDKGELLTKITATTPNGTYSTKTSTTAIAGKINFRKEVIIEQGATVTLNVKNGSSEDYKTVPVNECKDSNGRNNEFTFTYNIAAGDYVDGEVLDVTDWSFSSVIIAEHSLSTVISFPEETSDKRFKQNRNNIKILTDIPTPGEKSFTEENGSAVLLLPFDCDISKVGGEIVFEYDTTQNDFHVPAVLTASEYSEIKKKLSDIDTYYEKGVNGAYISEDTLANDTTAKYILKIGVSDTTEALVNAFKAANKHIVTIPVISDNVSVVAASGRALDGSVLKVELGNMYALPVKGAVYKLSIPAGAVSDAVGNTNEAYNTTVTAGGVEKPEIRIVKPSYTVTGYGNTRTATVNISEAQKATMYMSCRTPGAEIWYDSNTTASTSVVVHSNPINVDTTKTASVAYPTTFNTKYNDAVSLGADNSVSDVNAQGLKITIAARAKKGTDYSDPAYEYATRTVVKLIIQGKYRATKATDDDSWSKTTGITENGSELTLRQLRPYIMGGDSTYGPNSVDPFPLTWGDPRQYRLMAGDFNTGSTANMYGKWWWVSWDVSTTTYVGFLIGDVHSSKLGPSKWFPADYAWVPIKDKYPLYPGETLEMSALSTSTFPSGAEFSFGMKKAATNKYITE